MSHHTMVLDQSNKSTYLQEEYTNLHFQNLIVPFVKQFPYLIDFVNLQDKKNLMGIINSTSDYKKVMVTFNDNDELVLSLHEGKFVKSISTFRRDLDILEKAMYIIEDGPWDEACSYSLYSYGDDLKNDGQFILEYLQRCGDWRFVGERLLNDREYILSTLKKLNKTTCLRYLSSELQSDREIVLEAVKTNGLELEFASNNLKEDREIVLEAVKQNGEAVRFMVGEQLKSDKEIILTSLLTYSHGWLYSSVEYSNDKEFVMQAIKLQPSTFKYLYYTDLTADKEVVLLAVKEDPSCLEKVNPEMLKDRDVMMEAIKKDPYSLFYARYGPLNSDRELVMLSVKNLGYTLNYATKDLQADKEIVMAALTNHSSAWQYVDKNLLDSDREVVFLAAQNGYLAFEQFSDAFRGDREIALTAVSCDNRSFRFVQNGLNSDREIATIALSKDYLNYAMLGEDLKKDKSFLLPLIKKQVHLLSVVDKDIIDMELMLEAIKSCDYAIQYASEDMRKEIEQNRDVLTILKETGVGLELVDDSLQNDREFILSIVKVNGFALNDVKDEFKSDREIVLAALTQCGDALEFVTDPSLQFDKEIIRTALKNKKPTNEDDQSY